MRQTDTYYRCTKGRLKLRQFAGGLAELIAYTRPRTIMCARLSQYHVVPVIDADRIHEALLAALGVLVVVEKVRELSLYKNVRIHLDEVERLGSFLEFEAVQMRSRATRMGSRWCANCRRDLHFAPTILLPNPIAICCCAPPDRPPVNYVLARCPGLDSRCFY